MAISLNAMWFQLFYYVASLTIAKETQISLPGSLKNTCHVMKVISGLIPQNCSALNWPRGGKGKGKGEDRPSEIGAISQPV